MRPALNAPKGTHLIVEQFPSAISPLGVGDLVLVDRVRPTTRQREMTLRTVLAAGPGSGAEGDRPTAFLVFGSSRAELAGVAAPLPCWPYDGRVIEAGGDQLAIVGRVTAVMVFTTAVGN